MSNQKILALITVSIAVMLFIWFISFIINARPSNYDNVLLHRQAPIILGSFPRPVQDERLRVYILCDNMAAFIEDLPTNERKLLIKEVIQLRARAILRWESFNKRSN